MSNILISSAGRRVALVLAFKKELLKFTKEAKVFTADVNPEWSSACRVSDGYFRVPAIESGNYVSYLLDVCLNNNIKILIPTLDTELLILSKAKQLFLSNNIHIVVSDFDLISKCRDKRQTNILFKDLKIGTPNLIDKNNPSFPLFIKPYDGSLSKDIYLINCKEELADSLLNNPKLMFMEFINPKYFNEYTIDAYYDRNSNLKCLVPRRRIEVRGGEISKGITEKLNFYYILKEKLRFIDGAKGCLTIQVFIRKETEEILGIEINPRFGGGFPLSYASGANYPSYIILEYMMDELITFNENWIVNRVMLRFDSEIILDEDVFTKQ